jgi:hypothetical protein
LKIAIPTTAAIPSASQPLSKGVFVIAVTGATGHLIRLVIAALLKKCLHPALSLPCET